MKQAAWKWAALVAVVLLITWLARRPENPRPLSTPPASTPVERSAPSPKLLDPRPATPEHPLQSWERLLARDGSPQEDRAALADLVINYLQSLPDSRRPPLGTNDEITRALTDKDALGDAALPTSHPGIIRGQLVDRWGNPWHFHQQAADLIEVRSAGPDGRLFTHDDLAPQPIR